ncbi:MAG: hypothetical protein DSM106950_07255 [Stigonema ocellatum SAG 48.90 = DSM 106950]|nr:hypothetical protein [Stigonema ocellatum SAG 48.90 = DSM 106950]
MSQNRQDYFSKANLKERGWTDTAIVKFLGEEDKKAANSHNRYSSVCLYIKSRVITIEGTPEFKAWREKSLKRSESAKKGAQTRLLREAQAEQLRIEQLRDFNAKVNACVLGIQPLVHKELIQIVLNRWNEQNPSPQRFKPKTTKFSAEIKRLSKPSKQKFTALMNNANGVLTRHFDRVQKNANPDEFTKSINDLFASMRGFINFFNKEERLAQLIVVDLGFAEAIANDKNLEPMLNWLSEMIDLIEDDPEIAVGADKGIDLIPLVTEQVLFQHREALNKFQAYLVEIAAQFPLVPNRHEIINRKFLNELIQLYPALSQAFVKSISVDKLNWAQQEKEVLAVV